MVTATAAAAAIIAAARLALPQRCELCVARTEGGLLCDACERSLLRIAAACPVCALPSDQGVTCGACLRDPPPFAATIAAYSYAFPTDRLLQHVKYGGRLALAEWAGAALASAVRVSLAGRSAGDSPDRVVALPLAIARQRGQVRRRLRSRGRNGIGMSAVPSPWRGTCAERASRSSTTS